MDYNSTRSFTMTLAHRAVGDIRRGGFRQLRNYVDMCATLAKKQQQKDFFAYAQKALQRTDSCYYSLIHRLLDSVDEDRICTVGVNMGFGGLIYGASELKKQGKTNQEIEDDLSRTVDKGDIVRSMKLQKAINTGNSDSASRLRRLLVGRLGG